VVAERFGEEIAKGKRQDQLIDILEKEEDFASAKTLLAPQVL